MKIIALDVSASSTGWALWTDEDLREAFEQPGWLKALEVCGLSRTSRNWRVFDDGSSIAHGAWRLKSEWSREGQPHAVLHERLSQLHAISPFEHVVYERALTPEQRGGASNPGNDILVELLGHVKSFHYAYGLRGLLGVHRASWQKDFIGSQKRGTKRRTLLELIKLRADQLGFVIKKDDEAAAIGLLTYSLLCHQHLTPPWISQEVLRPALGVAR